MDSCTYSSLTSLCYIAQSSVPEDSARGYGGPVQTSNDKEPVDPALAPVVEPAEQFFEDVEMPDFNPVVEDTEMPDLTPVVEQVQLFEEVKMPDVNPAGTDYEVTNQTEFQQQLEPAILTQPTTAPFPNHLAGVAGPTAMIIHNVFIASTVAMQSFGSQPGL